MQERLVLCLLMCRLLEELRGLPSLSRSGHPATCNGKRLVVSSEHVPFPLYEQSGNHRKSCSNGTQTVVEDERSSDGVNVAKYSYVCVQIVILGRGSGYTGKADGSTCLDRPIRRDRGSMVVDDPALALHLFMGFSKGRDAVFIHGSPRWHQFTGFELVVSENHSAIPVSDLDSHHFYPRTVLAVSTLAVYHPSSVFRFPPDSQLDPIAPLSSLVRTCPSGQKVVR